MLSSSVFTGFPQAVEAVLGFLRQRFEFEVWMLSRIEKNDWIVLQATDPEIDPGVIFSYPNSYCKQMVEGNGPRVAAHCQLVEAYREAPCNQSMQIGAYIGIPVSFADGTLFGTLCAIDSNIQPESIEGELPLLEMLAQLLSTLLGAELALEDERRISERDRMAAALDPLTGIYNRQGWNHILALEEQRCRDYGHSASVIAVDLDDLKPVNDTQGHAAGDELLKATAAVLSQQFRPGDCVARHGGDEFWVLLVNCNEATAALITERLKGAFAIAGIRASCGWATRHPSHGLLRAMEIADQAMYADKRLRKASTHNVVG